MPKKGVKGSAKPKKEKKDDEETKGEVRVDTYNFIQEDKYKIDIPQHGWVKIKVSLV